MKTRNIIIICVVSAISVWFILYYFIFKFEWSQIASFWNFNWDKIIASIGSIATFLAVGITLYDIRRRYQFDKIKFEFESTPLLKPLPMLSQDSDFLDYHPIKAQFNMGNQNQYIKEQFLKYHLITASNNIFKYKNFGTGFANNLKVSVSNSPDFLESNTLNDYENSMASNIEYLFSTAHLANIQQNVVNFQKDFFVRFSYKSKFNNKEYLETFRAEVKQLKVLLPVESIHQNYSQPLDGFDQQTPNITITKEYTQEHTHYYIHNFYQIN